MAAGQRKSSCKQRHHVTTIHVFLHTSPFAPNYVSASTTVQLPYPTDDTRLTCHHARAAAALYRAGHAYVKAGLGLIELQDRQHQ